MYPLCPIVYLPYNAMWSLLTIGCRLLQDCFSALTCLGRFIHFTSYIEHYTLYTIHIIACSFKTAFQHWHAWDVLYILHHTLSIIHYTQYTLLPAPSRLLFGIDMPGTRRPMMRKFVRNCFWKHFFLGVFSSRFSFNKLLSTWVWQYRTRIDILAQYLHICVNCTGVQQLHILTFCWQQYSTESLWYCLQYLQYGGQYRLQYHLQYLNSIIYSIYSI